MTLAEFIQEYDISLLIALGEHIRLVGLSVLIAVAIGLPLGIWVTRTRRTSTIILGFANLVQTIPSIALFGLMIPVLAVVNKGIGTVPAMIALVLYAQLPIIRNTITAMKSIPQDALEAARGMGMTEWQIFRNIALPLALPGIITGIRLATTMCIGVAAIAAYIGAGGLGLFIARGIATTWDTMIIAGALGISLLALIIELLLEVAEHLLTPKGLRIVSQRAKG